MQYAVRWVWEMNLTVLLFTVMLVVALRIRGIGEAKSAALERPRMPLWAAFGILWGLIALCNPALIIFLPASGVWLLLADNARPVTRRFVGAALASLLFFACITPWIIRNYLAFHHFVPLRGNFGAELYLGNGPEATGLLMEYNHPNQSPEQLELYRRMGEIAYSKMRGDAAKAIIRHDPGKFIRNTFKRVYFFWFGVPHPADDAWYVEIGRQFNFNVISVAGLLGLALALRQRAPASVLFLWIFLLLPLTYYLVTVHARFRHPFEPVIAILAVNLFQSAEPRKPRVKAALQIDQTQVAG
jgi:4-amino-4-deoxy-L-arabinose transferase-like glycosyltransferase